MVTHFFFSCIIVQKKPKIQTHCGKWSWIIIIKRISDELRCSQFFFKSQRAETVSVKVILEITARYWYQTGPLTWLNMLCPKGKTLHCFCDNDLWQTGKKSVWNTNSTAGAVLVCYAAVIWGRHATLDVGRTSCVTKQRTAALETGLVVECLRKYIFEGDFMAQLATRRSWFRFSSKP